MKTLIQLIEEAYTLFSGYQLKQPFAVCTYCCFDEKHQNILSTTPLKELPTYTIYRYLNSACTENDVALINQMRYLLPRILELMINNENIRHSDEITLDKLFCKNPIWKPIEKAFLNRFAEHYFEFKLHTSISLEELFEVIVMFETAGFYDELINQCIEQIPICIENMNDIKS